MSRSNEQTSHQRHGADQARQHRTIQLEPPPNDAKTEALNLVV